MLNRRFTVLTFAAVALATFVAPASASAQSIWDRIRDRAEQERQRDDDDWRRNRRRDDDDRYGRNGRGGRMSDWERRQLRDLARRIDDRSRDLQRNIDRMLDNSRVNGTNREDRINDEARDFRNAASRFRGVAGDSDELYRSRDEASRLLQQASQLSRALGRRTRLDSRTANDWNQLRGDLRTVANIYNLRFNDDRGYNGSDDWGRGGNRRWE